MVNSIPSLVFYLINLIVFVILFICVIIFLIEYERKGKELTSKGGYFYLDDKKVDDVDAEVLAFVKVDEWYVEQLMAE